MQKCRHSCVFNSMVIVSVMLCYDIVPAEPL